MNMVPFNPDKHVGKTLYALSDSEGADGEVFTELVKADVPWDVAIEMPWLFQVDEDEVETDGHTE